METGQLKGVGSPPIEKMIREWRSENNHEDDFSGSDDDFLGFYDE
jgi:hypothetical protein